MRKTIATLATIFATIFISVLVLTTGSATVVSADPADVFPSGPYTATLIGEKILYPDLFGVSKGLPVADVSGVLLPDGKLRAYVFAQNKGIVIAESTDGVTFSFVGNAFGSDKGQGMPRVVKLSDGRFRMYNMTSFGVSCSISSDGLNFAIEKDACIPSSSFPALKNGLSGAAFIKLADGRYRAYFSDMVKAGTGPDPHQVYSATSADGVNWTADSGIRIGTGAASLTRSAEHPAAVAHADGSVTIFYYDNGARPGLDASGKQNMAQNDQGLWYSTSKDGGLTFSNEYKISFPSAFGFGFGNDPDVFLDKSGQMILWAGGFDQGYGGYIGAVKLTKGSGSAATITTPATKTTIKPAAKATAKVTITCVKGKVVKKVTGVKPVCPAGYKKK
jgi:hypothetical protein